MGARFSAGFVAMVAWFALALQLFLTLARAWSDGVSVPAELVRYFSYFTILTNLLVAAATSVAAFTPTSRVGSRFGRPNVAGAVAAYIAFVGIAYELLLRHTWNPQGWQRVAVGQITNTFNYYAAEITGGCKATGTTFLASSANQFFDIKIDKADRIAIAENTRTGSEIDTYNPPKNGSLGKPVSTTPLSGSVFSFAFLASGQDLYANINLSGAFKYDYPAGGAAENIIPFTVHGAIAVSPPLIP